MPLRFEHWRRCDRSGREEEGYTIFAGKMEVGYICKIDKLGRNDVRWQWTINQVTMNTLRSIAGGSVESADDAKRGADYVWSLWVAAAGLREAGNAPPD